MSSNSHGAKAANLRKLQSAGFNVPPFYTLPADTKHRLKNTAVREQLRSEFESWLTLNQIESAAVRSSAAQEDSAEASFAGQFKTVLDVGNGEDFLEALTQVLSSKPNKAYSNANSEVHAIVQAFVEPDCAGVTFSINPSTGSTEFVINAARGRGTNVVDGQDAEQYLVNRLRPDEYRSRSVSNAACVKASEVRELSELALAIERALGTPQDIEWAIRDGEIYILQARPITAVNHLRLWDSSNIAESFPGIVLPLTFSIAKRGYLLGYKAQAYAAGLSWHELEANHRTFDSMIGIFNGRMYYNLLSWYRYISLFPGSSKNQKFLDDQIATQGEAIYQLPPRHSKHFRISYMLRILRRVIFFKREMERFYRTFDAFEAKLARHPKQGDTQLLMLSYEHIEQTIIPHFGRTLDNDFLVMTYHGWLKHLLEKWLPNEQWGTRNIIGAMSGVMSAQQALVLYEIAKDVQADVTTLDLLTHQKFDALDTHIRNTPLATQIESYIETFGHRFAEDQKIEAINPVLEHHGLYKLLYVYVKLDAKELLTRAQSSAQSSQNMELETTQKLRPLQKLIYKFLLRKLKYHLRIRERNRLLRGRVYGHMRELFPKVGDALVREGVIASQKDVYYLQIEEIFQVMQGSLVTNDIRERVASRQKSYKKFEKISMPERFITKNLPTIETIISQAKSTSNSAANNSLLGLISSPGTVEGRVLVLTEPKLPKEPYDILVARHTDPGWTPLIALAKGVIVEHGGMLSHAAIVTRELGIPSIIGVEQATTKLESGMRVRINTQLAQVEILES